jgi:hypothetical protein
MSARRKTPPPVSDHNVLSAGLFAKLADALARNDVATASDARDQLEALYAPAAMRKLWGTPVVLRKSRPAPRLTNRSWYRKMQPRYADGRTAVIDGDIHWDPDGNVQHIAKNDITVDEVEAVLRNPQSRSGRSRRSGLPQVFGWTPTGKFITVIWEEVSDDPRMIYPVTAYEVPPPKGG